MKISDIGLNQQNYPVGKSDHKPVKAGAAKSERAEPSSASRVSLSSASKVSSTSVQDTGHFDAKKVEQIKSAIANGEFQVNPGKIADSLISSVHGLLGARA